MPAPLAKGLIIAASVLVAAGIAIYENPQVREWVDQKRRKIAVALHSLGDEVQPQHRRSSDPEQDAELRRRRKEELIRRNRSELIRRAREDGIAVDLDELERIGMDNVEMSERESCRPHNMSRSSTRSFDDLVGSDGKLKQGETVAKSTTAIDSSANCGLRRRGFYAGSMAADPFADEALMDFTEFLEPKHDNAPTPSPFDYMESPQSSVTLDRETMSPSATIAQLVNLTPDAGPEPPQTASIHSLDSATAGVQLPITHPNESLYSFSSAGADPNHASSEDIADDVLFEYGVEPETHSTGSLTPRSGSDGISAALSTVGSQADDIAVLSMQNDDDHDARSEVFSEGGFSEFAESEHPGALTPSSWTDVGSDDESEFGGNGVQGTQQWGQSTIQQH
ncbi:hypothetical protein GQ43DRAFT_442483 [Delitschia confertaspora ATCC 74209]|uniref:Uncharacterized protein n=1 Tax=Delitschia confertaspora ATCC 74209 TaxID=1513339 RepID=A0A9P4JHB8_9PLEO|nr:hypothetical protein GQ43DRAFT_442483 [Delitschia confertaspora ATCC 74209]